MTVDLWRENSHEYYKAQIDQVVARTRTTLYKHLKQDPWANLQPARGLGRQPMACGPETLDLAGIYKGALATLEASSRRDRFIKRAGLFLLEAIASTE
jgi:hypothetical protein